jgi:hypothetical protein
VASYVGDYPRVFAQKNFPGTNVMSEFHFWSVFFRGIAHGIWETDIEVRQVASGGRFQWVLDAACEAVEWLRQPLRFDSVVLRTALDL